ncbi:MAG: glycosyltransferase family 1 protein [Aurantimonas endophytica]|uniref:glycosyltransferase family 4 protein n=1 Tax=Aurantimonas endophytica TaxID=1522175 RepID=UPI003001DBBF
MRLWFDGQCLQTASNRRGIGRYAIELIKAIAENHRDIEMMISFNAAMPETAIAARESVRSWFRSENVHVWHSARCNGEVHDGYNPGRRLSEAALARHVDALRPDFAIATSPFEGMGDPAVPLLKQPGSAVPVASIFYDAIPRRFPKRYLSAAPHLNIYNRRLNAHLAFDLNLCISEFSLRELQDILGDVPGVNIYAGISEVFNRTLAEQKKEGGDTADDPYVLYVGGLDWRKNVALLPDAFALLDASLRDRFRFVVAGDYPDFLLAEVADRWRANGLPAEQLISRRHVSEADLVRLYRGASLLVQPSFMEGFGLTALEAMVCGTPVVAARAGALPEVVGDDRLLFDPSSADELAAVMTRVLTDDELREETVEVSKERAKRFTWERSAEIAVTALRERLEVLPKPSGEQLPAIHAERWRQSEADVDLAVTAFALAEPVIAPGRLIVDATSTIQVDHKTGIQRVVNKICRKMDWDPDAAPMPHVLSYCDGPDGWYDARGVLETRPDKNAAERLRPRPGDRILMLDSSWTHHLAQRHFFLAARIRGAEVYSCLYDLVPLRLPAYCVPNMPMAFRDWFETALAFSTGFVCISRAVADEFHALLQAIEYPHPMKIGYWRLGADFADDDLQTPVKDVRVAGSAPVFLMVGTVEPRKGHRIALDAFEQLWAAGSNARLVIAGKAGWGVEPLLRRIRESPELGGRLVWHEHVDDATLVRLYGEADALVAASHAEGFGLPIVEAAHFGKPVIASDIPVFREVGGGGADFFDVGSSSSLHEALEQFLGRRKSGDLPAARGDDAAWPSWSQSVAELEAVVLGDNWYVTYEPPEGPAYRTIAEIGKITMRREIPADERQFTLSLVEGATPGPDGEGLSIVVALTNLSQNVWSSRGAGDGRFPIAVGARVLGSDGTMLVDNPPRGTIPMVLIPGETAVLPVRLAPEARLGEGMSLDITVLQEGCAWWDGGIRVPL